jgi:hypothetical protein
VARAFCTAQLGMAHLSGHAHQRGMRLRRSQFIDLEPGGCTRPPRWVCLCRGSPRPAHLRAQQRCRPTTSAKTGLLAVAARAKTSLTPTFRGQPWVVGPARRSSTAHRAGRIHRLALVMMCSTRVVAVDDQMPDAPPLWNHQVSPTSLLKAQFGLDVSARRTGQPPVCSGTTAVGARHYDITETSVRSPHRLRQMGPEAPALQHKC